MPVKRRVPKERVTRPFGPGDSRILQHVCGHDFFLDDEAYGAGEQFDRDRMERDWRERREEILEFARAEYPHHEGPLWSELEFGRGGSL